MAVESLGDIHALPEDCIANALSLTSPKDACRLSAVASTFRSASLSDTVWGRFLPSDYRDLISRAVGGSQSLLAESNSKKDIYLHLCDHPILIDGGGKKCYMLGARELHIVWADTPQYWKWITQSRPEARFSEVAELLIVCWFEVWGKINTKMLSPSTNYAAYLVFSFKQRAYHGFENEAAKAFVVKGGHESEHRSVCLDPEGAHRQRNPRQQGGLYNQWLDHLQRQEQQDTAATNNVEYPKQRSDGWMEVELAQYFVKEKEEDGDLEVCVMEVTTGRGKSGLIIQGIEIRPKTANN